MRRFSSIHVPHFPHVSAHNALLSAREQLSTHSIEITMAVAILLGLLVAWASWVVVAH